MTAGFLLTDLRDTFLLFLVLSPFFIALSIDTLKYYAVVRGTSPQDLERFLAGLPKLLQRFYLSKMREVYTNKYSSQQMRTSFKVRRYLDSILPLCFIVATPLVWIMVLRDGSNILRIRYTLIPILLSIALWYSWHFGNKLRSDFPE